MRGAMLPVSRRCRTYRLTVDKLTPKVRAPWLLFMYASTAARIFRRRSEEYAFILHYRIWANLSDECSRKDERAIRSSFAI